MFPWLLIHLKEKGREGEREREGGMSHSDASHLTMPSTEDGKGIAQFPEEVEEQYPDCK